jgi:uroporphyrinogen decarboxylase
VVGVRMTKPERLTATLAGQETDRTPISFWHHFPGRDRTIGGLLGATLAFQRRYDLDFVKLTPTGMYCVVDYGATIAPRDGETGTTRLETSPIASPDDWSRLRPATPHEGELGAQVEVVQRLRSVLGPGVPIIQTIFSPLTIAAKLGGSRFAGHLQGETEAVECGIARFAEDCVAFGYACLEAGADGFFFATQHASRDRDLPPGAFERLGVAYDLQVLEALAGDERNWFTVLHLHGDEPSVELADRYPVHGVNWHDRETTPCIQEAMSRTKRALIAGIDRKGAIAEGDALAAAEEVRDAVRQSEGRRLVIAPGCVLPSTVCEETLAAVRKAVENTSVPPAAEGR